MAQTERLSLRIDPRDRGLIEVLRDRWGTGDEAKTIREAIRRAAEGVASGGSEVDLANGPSESDAPRVGQLGPPMEVGVDLVELARAGKLGGMVGRAKELERLLSLLVRRTRNSVAVVGERGTGKTALVEGLALRLADGEVPDALKGKGLAAVDCDELALVARYGDTRACLEWIERLVSRARSGAILALSGMGRLVQEWERGSAALGRLRLAVVREEAQVIGELTPEGYRRWAEADELSGRFEVLALPANGRDGTVGVLRVVKGELERHHGVSIGEDALTTVAALAADRKLVLPGGAVDLLDEAAARARVRRLERVTGEVVAEVVGAR